MDDFMKFMMLSGTLEEIRKDFENTEYNDNTTFSYNQNNDFNNFHYDSYASIKTTKYNYVSNKTEGLMCPECQKLDVDINAPYCPNCGCPIEHIKNKQNAPALICPECSTKVDNMAKFCNECGCPIDYIRKNQNSNSTATKQIAQQKYALERLFDIYDSIVLIDTETTGFNYEYDRIIELSAIKLVCKNEKVIVEKQMDKLISLPQGMRISTKITEITGITNEELISNGFSSNAAFNELINLFANEKTLLVAYNAQFDFNFLYKSLEREGLILDWQNMDLLDALTAFKDRRPYPHKLVNAICAYHLESHVNNTHRAIDDVVALAAVLEAMYEEYNDLDKYINLFGYNPKYGIQGNLLPKVRYLPQPYNNSQKLYQFESATTEDNSYMDNIAESHEEYDPSYEIESDTGPDDIMEMYEYYYGDDEKVGNDEWY